VAVLLLPRWLRRDEEGDWVDRLPWLLAPLSAALLSWGYVCHYLRGGPRIIDASAYWLQARALSEGLLSFPIGEPEHAVLGRFLLRTTVEGEAAASVIFPPGYPSVLALGFAIGAPMLIGPLLAAALTYASMMLTRRVVRAGPSHWRRHEHMLVRLTATISVLCATLRYHTADTMSHGLAALCVTVALCALLGPQSGWQRGAAPVAGLACGMLLATRPASAVAVLAAAALYLFTTPPARSALTLRAAAGFAVAAAAPVSLWFAHQHAATGNMFTTAQGAYYALSDGPPGCFRYGFGEGIGCLGEHGEFVRNSVGDSYGLIAALGTTGRRLKMHLSDALNFAPLFPLVAVGALASWRIPAARVLPLPVGLQIASYAPFYFDGNYPGGGARMYADVLPAEQVLALLGVLSVVGSGERRGRRAALLGAVAVAASLFGFAFQSGALHQQLRARDGGSPMFDPGIVAAHPRARDALLLIDTDHGFNLAYQPGGRRVARFHGDDLDRLSWERRGRPLTFRYQRASDGEPARLLPLVFDSQATEARPLLIEAESLWPPAQQSGGWAWPSYVGARCASRGRVLALYPTLPSATLTVRLPSGLEGRLLTPRVIPDPAEERGKSPGIISIYTGETELTQWKLTAAQGQTCVELPPFQLPDQAAELTLRLRAMSPVSIDSLKFREKR
jgi:hypothetical protein